jgi:Zn-dependent protease with chaperone function
MATNFFAAQDAARRRSRRLVALFLASLVGLIMAIYMAVVALLRFGADINVWWQPDTFVWVAGITTLVVGLSSLGKIMSLRAGGGVVARSVGGRRLDPTTRDHHERRLTNIVEEMSIAAGVPMPEIYVLDEEDSINAFAAGFSPQDAAVAVTRGCLEKLNRDELQGVVAHEFAHILNGDMRLNIQLIGLVFGLLVLSIIGQGLLRSAFYSNAGRRRSDNKEGGGLVLLIIGLGLILLLAGWLGVLFGRLLQSAVSRQREFLADASAVQFTRHPQGLAGALRKIGTNSSRVSNEHSQDVAHLLFASGLRAGWAGLFATHPPLDERIRAIDPAWDGSFESTPPPLPEISTPPPLPTNQAAFPDIFAGAAFAGTVQLEHAHAVRQDLAVLLDDQWQNPATARDLVLAMLPLLPNETDNETMRALREKISSIPPVRRLALVGMLHPALRQLDSEVRLSLIARLDLLLEGDHGLDAFQFGVCWIVRRDLRRSEKPPDRSLRLDDRPSDFAHSVSVLLASLVHVGHPEENAAGHFAEAIQHSPAFVSVARYPGQWPDVTELDRALIHLGGASFGLRHQIIDAATAAVIKDQQITEDEAALMQLVSMALDCPAPLPAGM